ncbi:MAG: hypothetical protein R2856_23395 [Caldilineaceae bacterium]
MRDGTRLVMMILDSLRTSGFRRIVLAAYGGNEPAGALATEWMADHPEVQVKFYQWWQGPKMMAVVRSIDPVGSHASWFENFAWTRLPGVDMPTEQKILPDRSGYPRLWVKRCANTHDGNYGGFYQRSDEEMQRHLGR